jgi:radical SAM protein with 4Fe4S-binding SPASM domain
LTIAWDGRVALCFQDADIKEEVGSINKNTIEQVWSGKHRKKRREHINGVFSGLCKGCDSYTAVRLPQMGSCLYPPSLRLTTAKG